MTRFKYNADRTQIVTYIDKHNNWDFTFSISASVYNSRTKKSVRCWIAISKQKLYVIETNEVFMNEIYLTDISEVVKCPERARIPVVVIHLHGGEDSILISLLDVNFAELPANKVRDVRDNFLQQLPNVTTHEIHQTKVNIRNKNKDTTLFVLCEFDRKSDFKFKYHEKDSTIVYETPIEYGMDDELSPPADHRAIEAEIIREII